MASALVFNPGSNSLKFEVVDLAEGQKAASEAHKRASASVENIGKGDAKLVVYKDRAVEHEEPCEAANMSAAVHAALAWLGSPAAGIRLEGIDFAGVRVVHGGTKHKGAVHAGEQVRADIRALEELAPLHNQSSLDILAALDEAAPELEKMVAFDTAFHRTLPETAWRYPIERETADRHSLRKFGFHGLSHRYMLEQYAATVDKRPADVSIVTLHLESGCSACAIRKGLSVDTTMGLTPLEGLMMGTRSGSIDPAIVPFLSHKENMGADDVLTLLNKRSGLLGIAGGSLDTRVLAERSDAAAKLALDMFAYRVRLAVGAYLAALGEAEAVLFGGGIGEDSPWLRAAVSAGLGGWGLEFDAELNGRSVLGQVCVSRPGSRLAAWAMPVEEGLQIAHECQLARLAAA